MLYCLQRELQLEFTCRLLEIYLKRENNNPSLKSCKNWGWFHIPFHYREQSVPYQSLASFKHSEFSPVLSRNFIFQDTRYCMCGNECEACWKRDFLQTSSWTEGQMQLLVGRGVNTRQGISQEKGDWKCTKSMRELCSEVLGCWITCCTGG